MPETKKTRVRVTAIHPKDSNPAHEVGDVREVDLYDPEGDNDVDTSESVVLSSSWGTPWVVLRAHPHKRNAVDTFCQVEVLDTDEEAAPASAVPIFMSTDSADRKLCPVTTGFLGYFPDAAMCVAFVSYNGNQKHNPGEPLHWAKEKSSDEKDAEARHMLDALRGLPPDPGLERLGNLCHLASKAWRAMADLQRACDVERAAYTKAQRAAPLRADFETGRVALHSCDACARAGM